MSGNSVQNLVATAETPEELEIAKIKAYNIKDNYSKMVNQCFKHCIGLHFKHNDIHSGEMICQNRCFDKYMEAIDMTRTLMDQFLKDFPDA